MKNVLRLVLMGAFLCVGAGHTKASKGIEAPFCPFVGKVVKREMRVEDGAGLSEGTKFIYVDVSVRISESRKGEQEHSPMPCDLSEGSTYIMQMYGDIKGLRNPKIPAEGACVKGTSHLFSDGNFMSGNWLTVVETLGAEACE